MSFVRAEYPCLKKGGGEDSSVPNDTKGARFIRNVAALKMDENDDR